MPIDNRWWRHAVVYQVYIRSFADGNGDGIGDISGLRDRLSHISSLGVDAIWINPWYVSPLRDGGYDVADYREINPLFGSLAEATELIAEARTMGLRVLVDLVPNHTSWDHEWFKAAVRSPPGSPERARYHFLPGRAGSHELPPNNWTSVFGGPAWTRVPDGEWYLHLFDPSQPDLNWTNPEVHSEFRDILRFWLDLGVSGFRVDVAHGLAKDMSYPDVAEHQDRMDSVPHVPDHPFWDRPEIHEIVREWRAVLDEYPETVMVAEAWLPDWGRLEPYLRPGEYHQTFDFLFLETPWSAKPLRETIEQAIAATSEVGSIPTWVLSNHDVVRVATRYGLPQDTEPRTWLLHGDRSLLDARLGLDRARAAVLLMLALPGSVYLYQGEELGLPEVHDLPIEVLDDPAWERSDHTEKGRDGCRVPIPWTRGGPSFGWGPNGSWLPQPSEWGDYSIEAQDGVPGSTLELCRAAIRIRRDSLSVDETLEWLDLGDDVIAFRRSSDFICVVNLGDTPVPCPEGELLLTSGHVEVGLIPSDVAVWVSGGR